MTVQQQSSVTGGCGPYTYVLEHFGYHFGTINGLLCDRSCCHGHRCQRLSGICIGRIDRACIALVSSGVAATYVCGTNVSCNGASMTAAST
jgi:hypothetical protein